MSRRPLAHPVERLAKAQSRMAPGGLLWSESPIPRRYSPRVREAGEEPAGVPESVYPDTPVADTYGASSTANESGTRITCVAAGTITALRFYRNAINQATARTMRLWDVATGTPLGSVATSGETALNVWVTVPLLTPVPVTAGQQVAVSFHSANGIQRPALYPSGLPKTSSAGGLTATVGVVAYTAVSGLVFPGTEVAVNNLTDVVLVR